MTSAAITANGGSPMQPTLIKEDLTAPDPTVVQLMNRRKVSAN
jgi:cell division protein FtsI/penicillin-binding protein 2